MFLWRKRGPERERGEEEGEKKKETGQSKRVRLKKKEKPIVVFQLRSHYRTITIIRKWASLDGWVGGKGFFWTPRHQRSEGFSGLSLSQSRAPHGNAVGPGPPRL